MAKLLMIQGTGSDVGKSLIVAGLCRLFSRMGIKVAPFKAQNMALNSGVSREGLEMGRAQILQAEAAGLEPTVEMNPILLKPTGDATSQVVVMGRPIGNMSAREYHRKKGELLGVVISSLNSLSRRFELILMEGAGSPAEINLKGQDLVNMGLAVRLKAPVVIVGDIDRGGVFASLYGTYKLLTDEERALVKGFLINKFRGDPSLLSDGIGEIERLTERPVLGVIPYIRNLLLDPEDSVFLEGRKDLPGGRINIKVLKLPRISNFTDFIPLSLEPGVSLAYIENPLELAGASLVIVPGSKNTLEDLRAIKTRGFHHMLRLLNLLGVPIMGICGGFQMLGRLVRDPKGVEAGGEEDGVGLLDAYTVMDENKTTTRVKAFSLYPKREKVYGYEIHMGKTLSFGRPFFEVVEVNGKALKSFDGIADPERRLFGTYIHGLFENDGFRSSFLELVSGLSSSTSYMDVKAKMLDELADVLEQSVDIKRLLGIAGLR